MEIDQEIKMKQKFIKTRMTMLGKLLPDHPNKKTAGVAHNFMMKVKSEYPQKPSLCSGANGAQVASDAIPLRDADVYAEPIQLGQKDVYEEPIVLNNE